MPYNVLKNDTFNRANTSVGSGANSTTGIGNGGVDFQGNLYNIVSNIMSNTRVNGPGNIPPLNGLYYNDITPFLSGRVRVWSTVVNSGAVMRFDGTGAGTGYGALIYQGTTFYVFSAVGGSRATVASRALGGSLPAAYVLEVLYNQVNSTTTQITFNVYAQADLNTVVLTYTVNDTTAGLQNVSGYCGHCSFGGSTSNTRIEISEVSPVLVAGVTTAVHKYKTAIELNDNAAVGGVGTVTYQRYRSTASGTLGTAISGATTLNYIDSGLTPNTDYYYTTIATDSGGTPQVVSFPQVLARTMSTSGKVVGKIGDSITAGVGSTALNAVDTEQAILRAAGLEIEMVNGGSPGSETSQWLPGQTLYNDFKARLLAIGGVDEIDIMLGTNNSKVSVQTPAATVKTHLAAIAAQFVIDFPALTKIRFQYQPYIIPGTLGNAWDANSDVLLQAYQVQQDTLIDNVKIFAGDKTVFALLQANNPAWFSDGVHPNQLGHTGIGTAWANVRLALLFRKRTPRRGTSFIGAGPRR